MILSRIGSSIVVSTNLRILPSAYSGLPNNPLCFLLYGGSTVMPFSDISDVSKIQCLATVDYCLFVSQLNFTFTDNSASEATAVFIRNAQVCSFIGNSPYFDTVSILNWPFVHIR